MNRFYLVLGGLGVVLAAALVYMLRGETSAPPAAATAPVAVTDDGFRGYTLGSDSAPVEVIEYGDFECPACANFAVVQMPTIRQQLIASGKVRWRYRDFPLAMHQYARFAAHAAQCAGEQGKFWEMHDALFTRHEWAQTGRNPTALFRDLAQGVGVDVARYDACMTAGRYAARIEFSRQEGDQRVVRGTPTFYVNGREFVGRPTSDAFQVIADSVARSSRRK